MLKETMISFFPGFDHERGNNNPIVGPFPVVERKRLLSATLKVAGFEVKFTEVRRRPPEYGVPTLQPLAKVHADVQSLVDNQEILTGKLFESDTLTDGVVDGELVQKELLLNVIADDPEEITVAEIQAVFTNAKLVIKKSTTIRLGFDSREEVKALSGTTKTIANQEVSLVAFKKYNIKALISCLRLVVLQLLRAELPHLLFTEGMILFLESCLFFFPSSSF